MEKPKIGYIYYLLFFTAPKVFRGDYFECLLTDQKVRPDSKIRKNLGHISNWNDEIYNKERFQVYFIKK